MTSPFIRNQGDGGGSLFAAQQQRPTPNELIGQQLDPTAPQPAGISLISDPALPTENAQEYVKNFDPDLYDLRDSSHLMRLIRATIGSSGLAGIRKQIVIARLSALLQQGSFLDLDKFWGAIFGLQRRTVETMPLNVDGTTVNPYTDIANSDVWDAVLSRDAAYRSRLNLLIKSVNMGATYAGLKGAAQAVLNCDVDITESWISTDFNYEQHNLIAPEVFTYGQMKADFANYGAMKNAYIFYTGNQFGTGTLPAGNRGEIVVTPRKVITQEERYQLQQVLNHLKPAHCMVTISTETVDIDGPVLARSLAADSEHWTILNRVTPAHNLINPETPIYDKVNFSSGIPFTAAPVNSDYAGEQWSNNSNIAQVSSSRLDFNNPYASVDDEVITYLDGTQHIYTASDGVMDLRQANAPRLSGEGVVAAGPYAADRIPY